MGQAKLLKGETAYDIDLKLSPTGTPKAVRTEGNRVTFGMVLTNNSLTFSTTQPFVGKWGNPRLGMTLDMEIEITLAGTASAPHPPLGRSPLSV